MASEDFIRLQEALAGRYSLDRELGRGGMGIVYLAHDVALDRPVALKLLQPQLADDARIRERFLAEARTAARLSHPHIIPIFAVDEAGDFVFFVMAYVDGETLAERIRARGPVPSAELSRILREVAWALSYAHANGVVHRDVKADNILLERGTGRALVLDFGIALVARDPRTTGPGEIVGTASSMSPEQAAGGVADRRSDIYSLGVVAYHALAGRLPFDGPSAAVVLAKHITEPPPSLATLAPGAPSRLVEAIERCLAKDPDQRFDGAEALADAVATAMASRAEAPFALRSFLKRTGDLTQNLLFISYFQASFVATGLLIMTIPTAGRIGFVFLGFAAIALAAEPVLALGALGETRGLLKAGYARDDAAAAWRKEIRADAEERAIEHGRQPGTLEKWSRRAFALGWTGALATAGAIIGGAGGEWADIVFPTTWAMGVTGGMLALWRHDGRTALSRRIAGRILESRLGRALFGVAGTGVDRAAIAALPAHRPTELAIGMAVDSLFDALPKAQQKQLAELPGVVRHLEADARRIRQHVEALTDSVARLEADARTSLAGEDAAAVDRRRESSREVEAALAAAKQRLAEAVAALETIRLDLLRLTAGSGTVDNLTMDLSEARALSEQVQRLLEARAELERELTDSLP